MGEPDLSSLYDSLVAAKPEWRKKAACKGMPLETFFPDPPHKRPTLGIAVCNTCKVKTECRREADSNLDMYSGVWGGTTQRQRISEHQERLANDKSKRK